MSASIMANDLDLAVIQCAVSVDASVEACWRRIGNFAEAGRYLDVPSHLVVGDGGIGSVRQIGDAITEVMVGRGQASYTYAQTSGPSARHLYHGCVALDATGPASCKLTYTISYNQADMDAAQRVAEHDRVSGRFQAAAAAMKRVVEEAGMS